MLRIRDALVDAGQLKLTKREYFRHTQQVPECVGTPDTSVFTEEEMKLVDEVIDGLIKLNAVEVSEFSHTVLPWWDDMPLNWLIPDHAYLVEVPEEATQPMIEIAGRLVPNAREVRTTAQACQ